MVARFRKLVFDKLNTWNSNISAQHKEWINAKLILTETAIDVLEYKKPVNKDYFRANVDTFRPLLDSKREVALNHHLNPSSITREDLTKGTETLQLNARYFE